MKRWIVAIVLACLPCAAFGQAVPVKYDSTSSTNSTLVRPGNAIINVIVLVNTTTTIYYLKFYDKVTAPTCNTDTVAFKIPVPFGASNAGGGAVVSIPDGLQFFNGVGFCLTANAADNDNTSAAAGVTISLGVKQ